MDAPPQVLVTLTEQELEDLVLITDQAVLDGEDGAEHYHVVSRHRALLEKFSRHLDHLRTLRVPPAGVK